MFLPLPRLLVTVCEENCIGSSCSAFKEVVNGGHQGKLQLSIFTRNDFFFVMH